MTQALSPHHHLLTIKRQIDRLDALAPEALPHFMARVIVTTTLYAATPPWHRRSLLVETERLEEWAQAWLEAHNDPQAREALTAGICHHATAWARIARSEPWERER